MPSMNYGLYILYVIIYMSVCICISQAIDKYRNKCKNTLKIHVCKVPYAFLHP